MELLGLAILVWMLLAGVVYAGWLLRDVLRKAREVVAYPTNERVTQTVIAAGLCVIIGFATQSVLRDESFAKARSQAKLWANSYKPDVASGDSLDEQPCEGRCYRDYSQPGHPIIGLELVGLPVTDDDLDRIVEENPQLIWIMLGDTGITDSGLASLRRLEHLEVLSLYMTRITDQGLRRLEALQNLDTLELSHTLVTDAGLTSLASLPRLRVLRLSGCRISDAGTAQLAVLPQLQVLDIEGTEVTDAGLTCLKALVTY